MRVDVYAVACDQPREIVAALASTLDPSEHAAAAARRSPLARDRWVVAHGALRALLGRALDRPARELAFERSCRHCGDPHHGKPVVAGSEIEFSLSHSGALAVIALARAPHRVGVDVELVRPRPHLHRLAARVLPPDAYDAWRTQPPAQQLDTFLQCWTAKEAYLKALGLGVFSAGAPPGPAPAEWTVCPIDVGTGAVATVAVDRPGVAVHEPQWWEPALP